MSGKKENYRTSKSEKSGLIFPVARVKSMLKAQEVGQRVSDFAAVYMTAILEYLSVEILELALTATREDHCRRIQPKHVNVAVKKDEEFIKHFKFAIIPMSEFIPCERIEEFAGQNTPVRSCQKKKKSSGVSSRKRSKVNSRKKK